MKPRRRELVSALRAALSLLVQVGSRLSLPGRVRLPFLKLAHRIQRLLLRDREPPAK